MCPVLAYRYVAHMQITAGGAMTKDEEQRLRVVFRFMLLEELCLGLKIQFLVRSEGLTATDAVARVVRSLEAMGTLGEQQLLSEGVPEASKQMNADIFREQIESLKLTAKNFLK